MTKFRGKGQIPRFGSKFHGPRKTVGHSRDVENRLVLDALGGHKHLLQIDRKTVLTSNSKLMKTIS